MDVSSILDQLNDAQRQAVTGKPTNQLILAGAGSGKTRVLVHRIAWLVQVENVSPYSVLAVTFTNKAAKEMRGRIEELLGVNPRGMWVGTFHGIAHRLLKQHWQEAGLPKNFQILDSDDQLRLVKRVSQSLNLDDKKWPAKQSQWFINSQKDEGLRPDYIQETGDPFIITMLKLYREYELACARGGMIDFGEILLRSHELWLKNPDLLAHYQQKFPFILVDEFQDTNTIQYAWLRVLAGNKSKLSAVGDDDQSIYGWRGAKIENIQKLETDFDDVQVVRLEQNYRSTETILSAANAVIDNNTDRLGKKLWTDGDKGEPIALYAAFNEQDEARFIASKIQSWEKQGRKRSESAILYRSNAQSRALEEALLRDGIPYRIYGGQRFYDRLEIRNALAYFRLLANIDDDAAFERVINTPTRGIGNKTIESVRLCAREQGYSMWQAATNVAANRSLPARACTAIEEFQTLITNLKLQVEGLTLAELANVVIHKSGLYEYHKAEKGEKGLTRIENLDELENACSQFVVDDDQTPLAAFLDTAALDSGDAQADEFEDAVQLMTLHSAKGLEFPLVFLAGAEENLFPHKMSLDEPGRLQEERRLCYVGITRAMQELVISYAENRRMHGTESYNSVSRFIKEIPPELINEVRIKNTVTRPVSFERKKPLRLSDEGENTGFYLGQRVTHNLFGKGKILHFEGDGGSARVQVDFESEGKKWLILKFAKLQACT